jgi:hypothetical protein
MLPKPVLIAWGKIIFGWLIKHHNIFSILEFLNELFRQLFSYISQFAGCSELQQLRGILQ